MMKNKKVLLVTAKEAFDAVKKYSGMSGTPARIHISGTDVAALISRESLVGELSGINLDDISIILLPGSVQWDAEVIEKEVGIPCFKGPVNAANLPALLDEIKEIELSTVNPADAVIGEKIKKRLRGEFREMKKYRYEFGKNYIHLLAEIESAPKLSEGELKRWARYYEDSGADMIDIGMTAGGGNEDKIPKIVETIKEVTGLPVSIDTLDEAEILSGVDSGVDLILSLDETNLETASSIDVSVVVIPRNKQGTIPKGVDERVTLLEDLVEKVSDLNKSLRGKNRIIADPVLDPLNFGFTGAVASYYEFRKKNPGMPMLMGVGNVTELLDADSVGVNALLMGAASELNIDIVFTVEASAKCRGSVKELDTARKMMYLARKHNQLPKDLGIDLLVLKDKKRVEDIIDPQIEEIDFVKVKKTPIKELEKGMFRIYLEGGEIKAVYYEGKKPKMGFRGKDAKDMYKTAVHRIKVSTEHAAYLGKELGKAETALKLGKNYIQDTELF